MINSKKKIAIDCRYLGMSGIGRFLEGILENIDFTQNEYFLVGKKEKLSKLEYEFTPIYAEYSPFSAKGLTKFPKELVNKCDVFFTPNFIVPFGIKTVVFTTIHDVVFMDIRETNNNFIDKFVKAYLAKRALKKSKKVFTVSQFSKSRILVFFRKYEKKIIIIGNSITKSFLKCKIENVEKENAIIFVGNIKKHKGLKTLLEAYEIVKKEANYILYIVGNSDDFITSDQKVVNLLNSPGINYLGQAGQQELMEYISKSAFLILPSYYEGFGIPPLEALFLKTKPIISDIPVFRELFSDFDVVFFECGNPVDLAQKILNTDQHVTTNIDDILKKYDFKNYTNVIVSNLSEENSNEK